MITIESKLEEMGLTTYEHEWGLMFIRHIDGTNYNIQIDIDEDEVKTQVISNTDLEEFLKENPHYNKIPPTEYSRGNSQ